MNLTPTEAYIEMRDNQNCDLETMQQVIVDAGDERHACWAMQDIEDCNKELMQSVIDKAKEKLR